MNNTETTEKKPLDLELADRAIAWAKTHRVKAGLAFAFLLFLTVLDPRLTAGVAYIAWLRAHSNSALLFGLVGGLVLWAMNTPTPAAPLL